MGQIVKKQNFVCECLVVANQDDLSTAGTVKIAGNKSCGSSVNLLELLYICLCQSDQTVLAYSGLRKSKQFFQVLIIQFKISFEKRLCSFGCSIIVNVAGPFYTNSVATPRHTRAFARASPHLPRHQKMWFYLALAKILHFMT